MYILLLCKYALRPLNSNNVKNQILSSTGFLSYDHQTILSSANQGLTLSENLSNDHHKIQLSKIRSTLINHNRFPIICSTTIREYHRPNLCLKTIKEYYYPTFNKSSNICPVKIKEYHYSKSCSRIQHNIQTISPCENLLNDNQRKPSSENLFNNNKVKLKENQRKTSNCKICETLQNSMTL